MDDLASPHQRNSLQWTQAHPPRVRNTRILPGESLYLADPSSSRYARLVSTWEHSPLRLRRLTPSRTCFRSSPLTPFSIGIRLLPWCFSQIRKCGIYCSLPCHPAEHFCLSMWRCTYCCSVRAHRCCSHRGCWDRFFSIADCLPLIYEHSRHSPRWRCKLQNQSKKGRKR